MMVMAVLAQDRGRKLERVSGSRGEMLSGPWVQHDHMHG